VFYLKDEADFYWDTVGKMQYEPGFRGNRFKELLKTAFIMYPLSPRRTNS